LSILYFAQLIKEAGFPPENVNILNGRAPEGGAAIASTSTLTRLPLPAQRLQLGRS